MTTYEVLVEILDMNDGYFPILDSAFENYEDAYKRYKICIDKGYNASIERYYIDDEYREYPTKIIKFKKN